MANDNKGRPLAGMQVLAFADGNIQASIDLEPGARNLPVIDAMYAFLDDFIGVNSGPPDDEDGGGGPEVAPPAAPLAVTTPTKGTA